MANLINLSHADVDSEYNLEGYDVHDSAGNKLGDIDGVIADGDSMELRYLVVDAGGWFSSKQFVVPAGDVREIDEDERRVYFKTLTKQTLESGQYPRYDESWWDSNAGTEFETHEREVARNFQPATTTTRETAAAAAMPAAGADRVDYQQDLYRRPAEGAQRLQLLEERLKVNKERYQAGEVRLGKRITEHTETVTVPLREERVVIERTSGSGQAVPGEIGDGGNETVEVEVMAERANVGKEAVVTEEVSVRKEATEREERVSDTVRREELVVEGDRNVIADSGAMRDPDPNNMPRGAAQENVAERAADRAGDAMREGTDRLRGRG